MKLLLDQNLSRRLLPRLEREFPGSNQVALLGMDRALDSDIWKFARDEGFVIVTKDVDFVELSLMRGFPPKIVWINLGNVANTFLADRLAAGSEAIRAFLASDVDGILEIE